MKQFVVEISDEAYKAMEVIALDPQEWLQNAIDNRARHAMDEIVLAVSDKNPKKISIEEKKQIVAAANIETAAERQARFKAETLRENTI